MNSKNFTALGVCALSFTAFAQGKAAPAAPAATKPAEMPMPTMPPEGKRFIEGLLGKWKSADVVMTMMNGKPMKGKLELDCEKVSSGWATLCKGSMDLGKEVPPQTVTFLMGWNIGDGMGTMFEMSNMGEVHNHTGTWTDDKSISLKHEGKTWEGKMEKDVASFSWMSPKEMAIKAEGTWGTTTNWTMSATARK